MTLCQLSESFGSHQSTDFSQKKRASTFILGLMAIFDGTVDLVFSALAFWKLPHLKSFHGLCFCKILRCHWIYETMTSNTILLPNNGLSVTERCGWLLLLFLSKAYSFANQLWPGWTLYQESFFSESLFCIAHLTLKSARALGLCRQLKSVIIIIHQRVWSTRVVFSLFFLWNQDFPTPSGTGWKIPLFYAIESDVRASKNQITSAKAIFQHIATPSSLSFSISLTY